MFEPAAVPGEKSAVIAALEALVHSVLMLDDTKHEGDQVAP